MVIDDFSFLRGKNQLSFSYCEKRKGEFIVSRKGFS